MNSSTMQCEEKTSVISVYQPHKAGLCFCVCMCSQCVSSVCIVYFYRTLVPCLFRHFTFRVLNLYSVFCTKSLRLFCFVLE